MFVNFGLEWMEQPVDEPPSHLGVQKPAVKLA